MKGVIYKYTFPNGKVYIGQTRRNPELRHREHIDPVTGPCNSGFWKEYQKFKEVKYEIIETVEESNDDVLVEKLNLLETFHILKCHAYDPQFGCNKRIQGTESTDSERILQDKSQELYNNLSTERMAIYNSISDKVWHTKIPLTKEEKEYMNAYFSQEEIIWKLPAAFNPDNLKALNTDEYTEDTICLGEAFQEWHWQLDTSLKEEISCFVCENAAEILEEVRDRNAICAIDKTGNVVLTFYSFNEIAQHFGVVRPDNVKNVLKGKQKSAYGYYWKYKRDLCPPQHPSPNT